MEKFRIYNVKVEDKWWIYASDSCIYIWNSCNTNLNSILVSGICYKQLIGGQWVKVLCDEDDGLTNNY